MSVKARIRPGDGDPRHGTSNGYSNHRCRCCDCRSAWADAAAALWRRRVDLLSSGRVTLPHGRYSTYSNWGCRCAECSEASALYQRRRAAAR